MNERDALLLKVLLDPLDDQPRLVFSDWLEERGEIERASFIRAQIRGEEDVWKELIRSDRIDWTVGDLYLPPDRGEESDEVQWVWGRGFVEAVTFRRTEVFLGWIPRLFQATPVLQVELRDAIPVETVNVPGAGPQRFSWVTPASAFQTPAGALRRSIFDRLTGGHLDHMFSRSYSSREESSAALSRACVTLGRRGAGLPPLRERP